MCQSLNKAKNVLSDVTDETEKLWKKAENAFPSMKKELTMRSRYYARKGDENPCGETFFKLGCDCGILRLILILFIIAMLTAMFGMLFCRKKKCH